jgi:hypothetical protein
VHASEDQRDVTVIEVYDRVEAVDVARQVAESVG